MIHECAGKTFMLGEMGNYSDTFSTNYIERTKAAKLLSYDLTGYGLVIVIHDDVIKWKLFPRHWPFVTGEFPSQRPVTRSFDVFCSAPEQTVKQTTETLAIWDAIAPVMPSL